MAQATNRHLVSSYPFAAEATDAERLPNRRGAMAGRWLDDSGTPINQLSRDTHLLGLSVAMARLPLLHLSGVKSRQWWTTFYAAEVGR